MSTFSSWQGPGDFAGDLTLFYRALKEAEATVERLRIIVEGASGTAGLISRVGALETWRTTVISTLNDLTTRLTNVENWFTTNTNKNLRNTQLSLELRTLIAETVNTSGAITSASLTTSNLTIASWLETILEGTTKVVKMSNVLIEGALTTNSIKVYDHIEFASKFIEKYKNSFPDTEPNVDDLVNKDPASTLCTYEGEVVIGAFVQEFHNSATNSTSYPNASKGIHSGGECTFYLSIKDTVQVEIVGQITAQWGHNKGSPRTPPPNRGNGKYREDWTGSPPHRSSRGDRRGVTGTDLTGNPDSRTYLADEDVHGSIEASYCYHINSLNPQDVKPELMQGIRIKLYYGTESGTAHPVIVATLEIIDFKPKGWLIGHLWYEGQFFKRVHSAIASNGTADWLSLPALNWAEIPFEYAESKPSEGLNACHGVMSSAFATRELDVTDDARIAGDLVVSGDTWIKNSLEVGRANDPDIYIDHFDLKLEEGQAYFHGGMGTNKGLVVGLPDDLTRGAGARPVDREIELMRDFNGAYLANLIVSNSSTPVPYDPMEEDSVAFIEGNTSITGNARVWLNMLAYGKVGANYVAGLTDYEIDSDKEMIKQAIYANPILGNTVVVGNKNQSTVIRSNNYRPYGQPMNPELNPKQLAYLEDVVAGITFRLAVTMCLRIKYKVDNPSDPNSTPIPVVPYYNWGSSSIIAGSPLYKVCTNRIPIEGQVQQAWKIGDYILVQGYRTEENDTLRTVTLWNCNLFKVTSVYEDGTVQELVYIDTDINKPPQRLTTDAKYETLEWFGLVNEDYLEDEPDSVFKHNYIVYNANLTCPELPPNPNTWGMWSFIDLHLEYYRTREEQNILDNWILGLGTIQPDWLEEEPIIEIPNDEQVEGMPSTIINPAYINNKPFIGVTTLEGSNWSEMIPDPDDPNNEIPNTAQDFVVEGGAFDQLNPQIVTQLKRSSVLPAVDNLPQNVIIKQHRGNIIDLPPANNMTIGTIKFATKHIDDDPTKEIIGFSAWYDLGDPSATVANADGSTPPTWTTVHEGNMLLFEIGDPQPYTRSKK